MATNKEVQVIQNSTYYEILMIEEINRRAGVKVVGLGNLKAKLKASMTEPDIAWVEKQAAEAFKTLP